MGIIVDRDTPVCVQGITGTGGLAHTKAMIAAGTRVVAGVAPEHLGERVHGVPVFDTCRQAVAATGASLSVSFVGRRNAVDSVLEAADAGLRYAICMEEFVPLLDALKMLAYCASKDCTLIGPNTNGLATPGQAAIGFFPREFSRSGPVGLASRSGTLTYGAMQALDIAGVGVSTAVGIGGGAARGLDFTGCLRLFADDAQTEVVVLIGEIGGRAEQDAADYLRRSGYAKPVVALIAGRTAPPGVAMGHAGAVAHAGDARWSAKVSDLAAAGVAVARDLEDLARLAASAVGGPAGTRPAQEG
jgi:succinyl-CoA synthetase alpha subunit